MTEYLITFHTHYDSLVCMRSINKMEAVQAGVLLAKLIPVPRSVSSSCGTALRLNFKDEVAFDKKCFNHFDYDTIYRLAESGKYIEV